MCRGRGRDSALKLRLYRCRGYCCESHRTDQPAGRHFRNTACPRVLQQRGNHEVSSQSAYRRKCRWLCAHQLLATTGGSKMSTYWKLCDIKRIHIYLNRKSFGLRVAVLIRLCEVGDALRVVMTGPRHDHGNVTTIYRRYLRIARRLLSCHNTSTYYAAIRRNGSS